ncbi:hypothetical protein QBC35DRAFT_199868 [Podospora australis]|uniref:Uncharacterized protein n=1 Tax=Podospora australis TaxID=1536484 RepID=A0AAN7AL35_9PEZI|nr:hypothetical protein QBC35DRAFT_199868 [Podospora australis]
MGNLCGKESDPFSEPGRRLDSASAPPRQPTTASVPSQRQQKQQTPKVGGPPRTLGGGGGSSPSSSSQDDARKKAAEAAEARLQNSKKGGKLKAQLDKERGKTRVDTLKDASETERRHRDADQSADALRND